MTITINLPETVEQAYRTAAETQGVSIDALIQDTLVSNAPADESAEFAELIEEDGIPVLRGGAPLQASVVNNTIEMIRRERDLSMLE